MARSGVFSSLRSLSPSALKLLSTALLLPLVSCGSSLYSSDTRRQVEARSPTARTYVATTRNGMSFEEFDYHGEAWEVIYRTRDAFKPSPEDEVLSIKRKVNENEMPFGR